MVIGVFHYEVCAVEGNLVMRFFAVEGVFSYRVIAVEGIFSCVFSGGGVFRYVQFSGCGVI